MSDDEGIPLIDAVRSFGTAEELSALDRFDQWKTSPGIWLVETMTEHEKGYLKWTKLVQVLADRLLSKLYTDEVYATGYPLRLDPAKGAERIASTSWRQAVANWAENRVSFGPVYYQNVRIFDLQNPKRSAPPQDTLESTSKIASIVFIDNQLSIGEKTWPFRGKVQIAVIKRLVENFENQKREELSRFIEATCPKSGALDRVFWKSVHWPNLKKFIRTENSRIWIEPTEKS